MSQLFLRIQAECGKILARKTPNTETFYIEYLNEN